MTDSEHRKDTGFKTIQELGNCKFEPRTGITLRLVSRIWQDKQGNTLPRRKIAGRIIYLVYMAGCISFSAYSFIRYILPDFMLMWPIYAFIAGAAVLLCSPHILRWLLSLGSGKE